MKNLHKLILPCFLIVVFACEGPIGPQGPAGPPGNPGSQGEPGINILGAVFDIETDFTSENNYGTAFTFPPDEITVYESDVVLVYILWDLIEDDEGDIPIWRPLPQTVFLEDGTFQYNYDYTFFDVNIFLYGNYDFSTLGDIYRITQTFRVVVMPADFVESGARYDYSNYEATIQRLGLDDTSVKKYVID